MPISLPIPLHWPRGYGLDVGWNRTASVWGARDRDTDAVYLWSEHYRGHAEPSVHAAAIRARGEWMQGAVDPAARGRGQRDGEQLLQNYIDLGLQLTKADNGVEAGLFDVWDRATSSSFAGGVETSAGLRSVPGSSVSLKDSGIGPP